MSRKRSVIADASAPVWPQATKDPKAALELPAAILDKPYAARLPRAVAPTARR